jgi:translation initiation factor 1
MAAYILHRPERDMASLHDQLRGLVYSTEHGETCPDCRQPINDCECQALAERERLAGLDGIVRIRRETSGRKGKGVTTIDGVPLPEAELKALAKTLKKRCGTGGAVKDGVIEIQGDQREALKDALEAKGYKVKLAGG